MFLAIGSRTFSSTRVPLNCSGAMYIGVPVSLVAFRYDFDGSFTLEMPVGAPHTPGSRVGLGVLGVGYRV